MAGCWVCLLVEQRLGEESILTLVFESEPSEGSSESPVDIPEAGNIVHWWLDSLSSWATEVTTVLRFGQTSYSPFFPSHVIWNAHDAI